MELPNLLLLIVGLLAVGQIGLAIFLWVSEKEFLAELARVLGIPQQRKQSWSLWHQSMKKAQAILGQAELEGVKVVADSKFYTAKLEGVYEDQMRLATARMEQEFKKAMGAAQDDFGKSLNKLEDASERIVDEAMVAFTKRLEEKIAEVDQKILLDATAEAKAAKEEMAAYKAQMTAKIRADMGEILGQVTQTVLGKKLTFTDQAELISEALEQAKKEKFL